MLLERAWLHGKIYLSKRTRLSKEVVPLLQVDSGVIGSMIDLGFDGDAKYTSTRSQMEKCTLLKSWSVVSLLQTAFHICSDLLKRKYEICLLLKGGFGQARRFFGFFLPAACYVLFSRLGRVALSLQPCSTPKAQNRKNRRNKKKQQSARQKFWVARLSNLSRSGLCFFFLRFFRFWGGRPLRRCDGLPF